jgi:hypothetical protein
MTNTSAQKIQLIQAKKYHPDPYENTPKNPPKIHAGSSTGEIPGLIASHGNE